jgi:hypothetical protein
MFLFSDLICILFLDFIHPCLLTYEEVYFMRFEVLTAACIKITVFRDVILCSKVDTYQCFRGTCCLPIQVKEQDLPKCWYYHLNSFTFRKTIILYIFHSIHTNSASLSLYKNFFIIFTSLRYWHRAKP